MDRDETHTLADVARLAGVSRTSASRVFLGQGKVSDETRRKVRAAADQLGYVPNRYASTLASGSSDLVGLLLRDAANPAYGLLFTELQAAAADLNLNLVSKTITDDPKGVRQVAALDLLLGLRVGGLIVATGALPSRQLRRFASQLPIIRAGRPEPDARIHAVSYDEEHAGRSLGEHVASLGHVAVAVLATPADRSYPEWVRSDAATRALRAAGVSVEVIVENAAGSGVGEALDLAGRGVVSAVVCQSDVRALAVLRAALARGLRVPEDLGVTGCDGVMSGLDLIGLTTYRIAVEQVARRTITALARLLDQPKPVIQEQIPGHLVPGRTVGRYQA